MQSAIPVNSLSRHLEPMQSRLAAATARVIESGQLVLGPHVERFERAFADYCGVRECIGVANGTDALEIALRALGLRSGEGVALVANAGMYATTAVLACGGRPAYVDVEETTCLLDAAALDALLSTDRSIRVLVVTHLYGRLVDWDAILPVARAHGIEIVEDCAQAHGAERAGVRAGAMGRLGCFSFYPTKNLGAVGDAGAVVTSDAGLAQRVRQLRQYGWSGKYVNSLAGGRNSRIDELQAAVLLEMLPFLDGWNARRRAIAAAYSRGIRHPDIRVPERPDVGDVAHLYVVQAHERESLRARLHRAFIHTDVHYPCPDHRQPCHGDAYADVHLPVTERLAGTALTLPCFPEMGDEEIARVVEACNRS